MPSNIVIIACSIFRTELEHLKSEGKITVPIVYLNSMLHMYPRKLQELLDAKVAEYSSFRVVLVFGDCHARMIDYEENKNVVRTSGINCCEIFLGTTEYKKIRNEGAFILLPEWAHRWREVFIDYMGFKNSKSTSLFMNDMHKKLVYVDTGYTEVNKPLLQEISAFVGLPLEVHNSSIAELEQKISYLLNQSSIVAPTNTDGR